MSAARSVLGQAGVEPVLAPLRASRISCADASWWPALLSELVRHEPGEPLAYRAWCPTDMTRRMAKNPDLSPLPDIYPECWDTKFTCSTSGMHLRVFMRGPSRSSPRPARDDETCASVGRCGRRLRRADHPERGDAAAR